VEPGEAVKKGDVIAKIHRDTSKTKDITGGLPRVAELFEVRRPKNAAIITKIEGLVSLGTTAKGLVEVSVKNEETGQVEAYPIPYGKHLVVYEGDRVAVAAQRFRRRGGDGVIEAAGIRVGEEDGDLHASWVEGWSLASARHPTLVSRR